MAERAPKPVPEGMATITPHLWFNGDCSEAIKFYEKAFDARLPRPPVPTPDGKGVMHVMMRIGNSNLMMADAWPGAWEHGPKEGATSGLFLYVEDCDAVYKKALEAGCTVDMPMEDMFWGDRYGKVKDPFGHMWGIATHKWIYTPLEMEQKQKEMSDKDQG